MVVLHPYQETWIADLRGAMKRHRRVLGVMPTGAGKTVCFAHITEGAMRKGRRVWILVHRALILDQISGALMQFGVSHGRIQPGWPPSLEHVQIGMIQTVARRHDRYPPPDLIIPDEAHHCVGDTYSRLLRAYPQAFCLGVTATPERLDGRGLGEHFSAMVVGPEIPELIAGGYLADYDYYTPPVVADLSAVPIVAGDYAKGALSDAMDKPRITGSAMDHYRRLTPGWPSLWFCVSVKHAEHVAEEFRAAGYQAASIDGTMSEPERRKRLAGLADGSLHVLTSCDLIGEGVDVPAVSIIGHLRPTKSLGLKKQFDGRGLRVKPDGRRAVILDHVGNSELHGTPRTLHTWSLDSRRRKPTLAGVKQCPACYRVFERSEVVKCANPQPGCLIREPEAPPGLRRQIEQVEGELVRVADQPAWAAGASLALARGEEYRDLLHRARTPEQLRDIAHARGYKRGWEKHIMTARNHHVEE
ncbi:MAG: DEAD/DEAH box helicase [Acidobacteriaceae bacterium]